MSNNGKVCAKCCVELRPEENGVTAVEMASFGPVAVYMADLWKCPGCGAETILGFGAKPIVQHFEPAFEDTLAKLRQNTRTFEFWLNIHEKATVGELA